MAAPDAPISTPPSPPARPFSQGVGVVFQGVGVSLFVATALVCCGSGMLSREWATSEQWTRVGWASYPIQRAVTVAVLMNVFLGVALAGLGLGMQAERRLAAPGAVLVTLLGVVFWTIHVAFAVAFIPSLTVRAIAIVLVVLFATLLGFAIAAWREVRCNPPPPGHEILPADYKVPYSHMHADPPEVRLERELANRRERLAIEQRELELMEEKLRRKMRENEDRS